MHFLVCLCKIMSEDKLHLATASALQNYSQLRTSCVFKTDLCKAVTIVMGLHRSGMKAQG